MTRLLPISGRKMSKILEKLGFEKVHQVGSHARYVHPTKLKLDMNPYLDKDYFISRKIKQGVKKLKSLAKSVWGKVKNVTKPETMTMTNNCCPN